MLKNKLNILLVALVVILGVGLAITAYGFYQKDKKIKDLQASNSATAGSPEAEAKAAATVEKLKTILNINDIKDDKGDVQKPAVATIVDADKVRESNKEFYADAQKDDALIVYSNRAILYRESSNKIINIAPIVANPTAATGTSATPAPATTPAPAATPAKK
jgi:flagellar basal body-associated protein FliL